LPSQRHSPQKEKTQFSSLSEPSRYDPNQVSWAGEISLDVEWTHAVAPYATLDLVLAKSNQDADILSVTKYAVDHNLGDVISQSFGENKSCVDPALLATEKAFPLIELSQQKKPR
jgi:hypothetical protein